MTAVGTKPRLELERRFAVGAVTAAARLTSAVRRDFDATQAVAKDDASPVTVADLGAQALVSLAVSEALPGDRIMGEEDAAPLRASADLAAAVLTRVREQRGDVSLASVIDALDRCDDPGGRGRRWWTLDPVDGTKGFLRNEQYAIALALIEDDEVVLAVMASPNLPRVGGPGASGPRGCLFVAERGSGAWQLRLDTAGEGREDRWDETRIRAPELTSPAEARYAESVESSHSNQSDAALIAQALGITAAPVRLDSQTKYAVVARGDASVYLRLPHGDYLENVWDHAAGALIINEAGGRVSDIDGRPLDVTTGRRLTANRGIVAAAASIHEDVLAAVRAVCG